MLERLIGDWRQATITEIRLIAIAVAASVAATAAVALACAAVFAARDGTFRNCRCVPDRRRQFFWL